ncbi:MAG: dynamin family protein [Candidatus Cloacimonetes bacterium]|nr:dynamin family protein [Candidatus Cloacimonadota bacterium]
MNLKTNQNEADFYQKYKGHINLAIEIYKFLKDNYNTDFSEEMKERFESISNKRYTIAVLGKVKSGKSTFINALLQEELLPTGVLETTAAIIEIHYSENKSLSVEYLDGNTITFHDGNIKAKLEEITVRRDDNLPLFQINRFLKKNYDSSKKEVTYTDNDFRSLIDKELPAPFKQKGEDIENNIKQYIDSNKNGAKIPVKIQLHYPHRFKLKETIIVDTPGLETISGLDAETKEYISKADAILYLHKDDPAEKTLYDFVKSGISKLAENNTFILLPTTDVERLKFREKILENTKHNLPKEYHDNKIYVIDSIQELSRQKIKDYKNECEDKKTEYDIFDFVNKLALHYRAACLLAEDESKKDPIKFQTLLEKYSNFDTFETKLNAFLGNALNEQLRGFLNEMIKKLEEQKDSISEQIKEKRALTIETQWFFQQQNDLNNKCMELETMYKDLTEKKQKLHTQKKGELQKEFTKTLKTIECCKKNYDDLINDFNVFLQNQKVTIVVHKKNWFTDKQLCLIKKFSEGLFNSTESQINSMKSIISSIFASTSSGLKSISLESYEKLTQKMLQFGIETQPINEHREYSIGNIDFEGKLGFDHLFISEKRNPNEMNLSFVEKYIYRSYSKDKSKELILEDISRYIDAQSAQLMKELEEYRNSLEDNIGKLSEFYSNEAQSYKNVYTEYFKNQQTELDIKKSKDKRIRDEIVGLNGKKTDITAKIDKCIDTIGEV